MARRGVTMPREPFEYADPFMSAAAGHGPKPRALGHVESQRPRRAALGPFDYAALDTPTVTRRDGPRLGRATAVIREALDRVIVGLPADHAAAEEIAKALREAGLL